MRYNFLRVGWLYVIAIVAVALTCCALLSTPGVPAFVSLANGSSPAAPAGTRSR
jgi:hypothetical protein